MYTCLLEHWFLKKYARESQSYTIVLLYFLIIEFHLFPPGCDSLKISSDFMHVEMGGSTWFLQQANNTHQYHYQEEHKSAFNLININDNICSRIRLLKKIKIHTGSGLVIMDTCGQCTFGESKLHKCSL